MHSSGQSLPRPGLLDFDERALAAFFFDFKRPDLKEVEPFFVRRPRRHHAGGLLLTQRGCFAQQGLTAIVG